MESTQVRLSRGGDQPPLRWMEPAAGQGPSAGTRVHSIGHWLHNRGGESLVRKLVRYLRIRGGRSRTSVQPAILEMSISSADVQHNIRSSYRRRPCGVMIQHFRERLGPGADAPAAYWPAFGGIADNIARIVDMEQAQQAATILRESFSDRLRAALERSLSVLSRAVPRFFLNGTSHAVRMLHLKRSREQIPHHIFSGYAAALHTLLYQASKTGLRVSETEARRGGAPSELQ